MKQKEITFICPHCHKTLTVLSQNKANHIRWCKDNPNRQHYLKKLDRLHNNNISHIPWNKGLTVETDSRVAVGHQKLMARYKSGELKGSWNGRHHTEETKKQMSNSALNSPHQRICKKTLPYTKKDGTVVNLDSSYERFVAEWLDKHNIEWTRPDPLNWIDSNGIVHHYFPDFYIPSKNIYLDPKNEYSFKEQEEKVLYISNHYTNVVFLHIKDLTDKSLSNLLK